MPAGRSTVSLRRAAAGALLLVTSLLVSCSSPAASPGGEAPSEVAATPLPFLSDIPADLDPQLLEPLRGLPPCDVDPETVEADDPGLVLPPSAAVTDRRADGPLVQLQGYMPYTPVQVRVFYATRDELEILQSEDEVRESEILASDGEHRLFVKAQAVCDHGSVFIAVLAPEVAATEVPTPQGTQP